MFATQGGAAGSLRLADPESPTKLYDGCGSKAEINTPQGMPHLPLMT
jgi:hypothetical protein